MELSESIGNGGGNFFLAAGMFRDIECATYRAVLNSKPVLWFAHYLFANGAPVRIKLRTLMSLQLR